MSTNGNGNGRAPLWDWDDFYEWLRVAGYVVWQILMGALVVGVVVMLLVAFWVLGVGWISILLVVIPMLVGIFAAIATVLPRLPKIRRAK